MPRPPACFAGAALAALLASACAQPPRSAAAEKPWVVATTVDIAGVNELVASGSRFTNEILDLLFDGLLAEQADFSEHPPSFRPALAESWQADPDGLRFVFRLRADARWSDGEPVTADDVVFSHRAQTSEEVAWAYADSKEVLASIAALDPRTVEIRLRRPHPYALVDLNDGLVLPAHAWGELPFAEWRRSGDWFRQHLVTNGPYRLVEWKPGTELTLERDPGHWDAARAGGPSRVVFRVVPDAASLVEQLLAGAFDFYDGLTALDAERVARTPGLELIETPARQFDYIGWNLRRAPFDDPRVRRALTLGIDRQALVDALFRGHARVAVGPVPAGFWARDRGLAPWPYDPGAARALLAECGFRDGDGDGVVERDGAPLRFELATNSGNRARLDATVLIQEQLRRIGVAATPRSYEFNALGERMLGGEFDAVISGWAVDTTLDLRPYFASREIRRDGLNYVAYRHAEVDELLDATRNVQDLEASRPLFARLQAILHEEQPYTFLWEPTRLSAVRAGMTGVEVTPLSALATLPRWRRPAGTTGPR